MDEKESRFDDKLPATPPPSPLRASNTLESLRPRDISWPTATLPSPGYVGAPADVPPELEAGQSDIALAHSAFIAEPIVRKTDKPPANVLPVNWPASSPSPEKAWRSGPDLYDRVQKLEGQVDSILDRLAKHNVRSSHKI
jgi:hypothetical protein